jgi:hypothetical protein
MSICTLDIKQQRVRTEVDGLLETRFSKETCSIADTATGRNELSSTTMNCIGVKL